MKYFKFALLSIYDNVKLNLLMIIEIVIVLIGTNIIVGGYNNRNMLFKPYQNILNKTGWYMLYDKNVLTDEPIVEGMKGNLKEIRMGNYFDSISFDEGSIPIRIKIVPDEIINNMKLSVYSGKWETRSDNEIVCISAPNKYGIGVGDVIKTPFLNGITVKAVLTDPCFLPSFIGWSSNNGIEDNFYQKYSIKYYDETVNIDTLELIMSESEFNKTGLTPSSTDNKLILYDEDPTEENIDYNKQVIKDNYQCGVTFSDLKYRAELSIKNLMSKYLPIAICAFVVILLGFISCTAVNTLRQMKNYGTLFTCGMNWSDCIKICAAYTAVILICSSSLAVAVYSIIDNFNMSATFGLSFERNNIWISAIVVAMIFLLNLIIPVFIIKSKTPVDIMREGEL